MIQFKRGDFSTCDEPRPGRPKTVTIPDFIEKIHELILEDHRILAKSIAEQLGTSRERVGSIIHEDLYIRQLSANSVPLRGELRHVWTRNKKFKVARSLRNIWNFFCAIQMISCRVLW